MTKRKYAPQQLKRDIGLLKVFDSVPKMNDREGLVTLIKCYGYNGSAETLLFLK